MKHDDARFSRPRRTTGLGKNLERVSTDIPKDVKFDLAGKVKSDGYETVAEWLRDVCIVKARGFGTLKSVSDRRLASVSEIVPEKDLTGVK